VKTVKRVHDGNECRDSDRKGATLGRAIRRRSRRRSVRFFVVVVVRVVTGGGGGARDDDARV
jgi:hypothetical protein|tara:strand:+ start:9215 stop:9400 length:186 start_codon:yes stop_codon:yes gene_type:complete